MSLQREMMTWIIGKDTGLSSQTLWAVIMNMSESQLLDYCPSIPYDTDDFGRCHRLLELCDPKIRGRVLKTVAKKYRMWIPFSNKWDVLTDLFLKEKFVELDRMLSDLRHHTFDVGRKIKNSHA